MRVPNYPHRTAVHCGSGTLANVLAHRGVLLSEPMVFGLGAGLGFALHEGEPPQQASRFFVGRSPSFEQDLCDSLGVELVTESYDKPAAAWARCCELVAQGKPALVYTDLFELPYMGARNHWYGHLVAVIGHEADEAIVSDNERLEPMRVPIAALQRALGGPAPVPVDGIQVLSVGEVDPAAPKRAREAVLLQAVRLTEEAAPRTGIRGLRTLAEELPSWKEQPDADRCFRLAAQIIEKRGTGGGLFRRLYARFLEEAGLSQLEALSARSADAFTKLAQRLSAENARGCADAEEKLWTRALELVES
ncbi:MAG TPA: BtrH N-terminal domain-containing protein [Myxococcales bacterium]|nr:BtrH N-terminal domain-containing protein [Myxococcales bacterium]